MKKVATFTILWATALILLVWLGDYNMYLVDQHGVVSVKEYASVSQRLIFSILSAAGFSFINTGLLWCLGNFRKNVTTYDLAP